VPSGFTQPDNTTAEPAKIKTKTCFLIFNQPNSLSYQPLPSITQTANSLRRFKKCFNCGVNRAAPGHKPQSSIKSPVRNDLP
jgi:hypothetical protein